MSCSHCKDYIGKCPACGSDLQKVASEIPEDILNAAKEALGESWCASLGGSQGWIIRRDAIARAILAERERCAKIADRFMEMHIAEAIRNPKT